MISFNLRMIIIAVTLLVGHKATTADSEDVHDIIMEEIENINSEIQDLIDSDQIPTAELEPMNDVLVRTPSDDLIWFHLYRRSFIQNPTTFRINYKSMPNILQNKTNYERDLKTKVIIHGWRNHYQSNVGQMIKNAYLNKEDMNVFVIGWSKLAENIWYPDSAKDTQIVGLTTARLLDHLVLRGTSLKNIHVIGHSLGAHAAGFTGASMRYGKIARITGLDPAGLKFEDKPQSSRLDPSDAQFVDVIHTCANVWGARQSLGHADFWPNEGKSQPGCWTSTCSHSRAYKLFAASIENEVPFIAYPCKSYKYFKTGKCTSNGVVMGDATTSSARGSYYLKTGGKKPYVYL